MERISTRMPMTNSVVLLTLVSLLLFAPVSRSQAVSTETTVISFPADDRPEGITFDRSGALYVGNRHVEGGVRMSRILKIDTDGTVSVFATLETAGDLASAGLLGLASGPRGCVYAAVASLDPQTRGVWRIGRNGTSTTRLPSSQNIVFPNALTFDGRGNLYVTDSVGGAVWRFPRRGPPSVWLQDALLEPGVAPFPGLPPIGANGIAWVPPDQLFVANTRQGAIVRIPIAPDGNPGEPAIVAQSPALLSVDGIAVDALGFVHAAIAGFALIPGSHPLVRVDPASGGIEVDVADPSLFHFPVSLSFGSGSWDHRHVFVVNSGALRPIPGPGPGVVQIGLGVPGAPIP